MADTGVGIPAGLTGRVFEELYQVPGVRRGGAGLGLPASAPAVIVTGAGVPLPPRAAALLRKDELTRDRLEFTIRGVIRDAA